MKLFAPEGSAEGCASGDCLPETTPGKGTGPPTGSDARSGQRAGSEASAPPAGPASGNGAAPGGGPSAPAALRPASPPADERDDGDDDAPAAPSARPVDDAALWRRAVDAVREASPRHGKSLSYARFLGFTAEGARIAFPPEAGFHRAQVTGMSRAVVEAELARALKRPIKLVEDTSAQALQAAPRSIAEEEASDRATREKAINDKVRAHPALRTVVKHLGGALEHVTVLDAPARPVVAAADEGDAGPPVD